MIEPFPRTVDAGPSFLTNHAFVLMMIGGDHTVRMRDLALQIGITERAVQRIVDDLVSAEFLIIDKSGRRNSYNLNTERFIRNPISRDFRVSDLLELGTDRFNDFPSSSTTKREPSSFIPQS